jgi:hypothetical protein
MAQGSRREDLLWKAVSTGSGVLGAVITRRLLQAVWPGGDELPGPPYNPADRRIPWTTAIQWAIGAGVGAGLARVLSQRAAAAGWEKATGSPPPGVRA